jgi:hypothetical protein
MKYSELLKEIDNYNAKKGFWRRLFGDSPYIKALNKFLYYQKVTHIDKRTLPDSDLKFSDFEQFATNTYSLPSFSNHMMKNTLSGRLLLKWSLQLAHWNSHFQLAPVTLLITSPIQSSGIHRLNLPPLQPFPARELVHNPLHSFVQRQDTASASLPSFSNGIFSNLSFFNSTPISPLPQRNFYRQRRRIFTDTNARFFVNEDGLVHDDFSSPPSSPRRPLSELNPTPPPTPRSMYNQSRSVPTIRGPGAAPAA